MHDKHYHKIYYEKHMDKMRQYQLDYYYNNRERLIALKRRRVVCQCGANVCYGGLPEHYRSRKHMRWETSRNDGMKKQSNGTIVLTFD